jgi:dTDP-L-rhamnose 4-epimerase
MTKERVLVTGGAGFIGSHLVDRLVEAGYGVRVLDALLPQIHGDGVPTFMNREAEFRRGDVRDPEAVRNAISDVDVIVHFAAAVGVGQSMYEVAHYASVNVLGTATILDVLVKGPHRLRRMIVASSMSVYGEGLYLCEGCGPQSPEPRSVSQLAQHDWAMRCPTCGEAMESRPTPETKPIAPTSIYALNKRDQEGMMLLLGRSLMIPTVALRFFNVYGQRQALVNPYTGVCAIFSSSFLNGQRPLVFEDGNQERDFIHVSDVVGACMLAIERSDVGDIVVNVGTGRPTSLLKLAALLRQHIARAKEIEPEIVGQFREGDIRACYADARRAQDLLGFSARVQLEDGVKELAAWVSEQSSIDRARDALAELQRYKMLR